MFRVNPHELDFEADLELGASPSKPKKKKRKVGAKLKKAVKAVATGGISVAASGLSKTKVGRKVKKGLIGAATGGLSTLVKSKGQKSSIVKKLAKKPLVKKIKSKLAKLAPVIKSARTIKAVEKTPVSSCNCKADMVRLVAAKLVAKLGPPLASANRYLAKDALRQQATYEHKKLMTDADFRRRVLAFIASKARSGNRSCGRTLGRLAS